MKETIETSLGKIWVTLLENGEMRVWWPHNARVGDAAVDVLRGRARWDPQTFGWYVSVKHRDSVHDELSEL
jgi:hypothetical protein